MARKRLEWLWDRAPLVATFAALGFVGTSSAATFVVNTAADTNGGPNTSLRDAINAANNQPGADTITFDPSLAGSTITLYYGELDITDDVTVTGPGSGDLTVRAYDYNSRIFDIDTGTASISGLTIRDGYSTGEGGGIYAYDCDLTLTDCVVTNNGSFGEGGGVALYEGSLTATDCTFSNNTSYYEDGGGVRIDEADSVSTLTNCTFANNEAYNDGGGLAIDRSPTVYITDCTFTGNSAVGGEGSEGGALYADFTSLIITNSTFMNNRSDFGGGGIFQDGDEVPYGQTLTITDCTITGNVTHGRGGGVYTGNSNTLITGSTISNNLALEHLYGINNPFPFYQGAGGGVYAFLYGDARNTFTMQDCTVDGNLTEGHGGGVFLYNHDHVYEILGGGIPYLYTNTVSVTGTTFSNNTAGYTGGGMAMWDKYEFGGQVTLSDVAFTDNSAGYLGGGFSLEVRGQEFELDGGAGSRGFGSQGYFTAAASLTIENSVFTGNSTAEYYPYVDFDPDTPPLYTFVYSVGGGGAAIRAAYIEREFDSPEGKYDPTAYPSNINITGTTFSGNQSAGFGGGLLIGSYYNDGLPVIRNCVFNSNGAGNGGGGMALNATRGFFSIDTTNILNNSAQFNGGGVLLKGYTDLVRINNCTISGNVASLGSGGGVYAGPGKYGPPEPFSLTSASPRGFDKYGYDSAGFVDARNSNFANNSSYFMGGAIGVFQLPFLIRRTAEERGFLGEYAFYVAAARLDNCVVSGNSSTYGGGVGTRGFLGSVFAFNSTLSGNTASLTGGAVDTTAFYSLNRVAGSIVSGNQAGQAGGAFSSRSKYDIFYDGPIFNDGATPRGIGGDIIAKSYLVNSTFSNNRSGGVGGAFSGIVYYADPLLGGADTAVGAFAYNCQFTNNTASLHGGAFHFAGEDLYYGGLYTVDCNFNYNIAGLQGGAISVVAPHAAFEVDAEYTTFLGNRAGTNGGAISMDQSHYFVLDLAEIGGFGVSPRGGGGNGLFLDIDDSTFTSNVANNDGGAIALYAYDSYDFAATIDYSTFTSNRAVDDGGAIAFESDNNVNGYLHLYGCTISNNRAGDDGGGLLIEMDGQFQNYNNFAAPRGGVASYLYAGILIVNTTISGNQATNHGGGVYLYQSYGSLTDQMTIFGSTLSGNRANFGDGGAISQYVYNNGSRTQIINSTISGNTAFRDGGGIYSENVYTLISHSTIAKNTAISGDGGGVINHEYLRADNSIFGGNSAGSYGDDVHDTGLTGAYFTLFQDYFANYIIDNSAYCLFGYDPKLAPLANNGGPTQTHAISAASPAFNAGDPSFYQGLDPYYDQRGFGFQRVRASYLDMGAFEATGIPVIGDPNDMDSDYDGWSDDFENQVGSDPYDASSTPLSGQDAFTAMDNALDMNVIKARVKLNFAKVNLDNILLQGEADLGAPGFDFTGQSVGFDVGGVVVGFQNLSSKGKGINGNHRLTIKYNKKTGLYKFNLKAKKGDFQAQLANSANLDNADVNNELRTIPIMMLVVDDSLHADDKDVTYKAKTNKSGRTK